MNDRHDLENAERERLSREMNHRLQNNVQWLAMLLEFQPARTPADAVRILNGVAARLRSLSAVFALRSASRGGLVSARALFEALLRHAATAHGVTIDLDPLPAAGRWQVADGMTIAAALLLGEILSNAIRHRTGNAAPSVSFSEDADGVRITVRNAASGAGFEAARRGGNGVGLELADTMTQMKGGLSLQFDPGDSEISATVTLAAPALEPAASA